MNQKTKIFYSLNGFIAGIIFILFINFGINNFNSLPFPFSNSSEQQTVFLNKSAELIKSGKIKEVRIEQDEVILRDYLNEDYRFSVNSNSDKDFLLKQVISYNASNPNNLIDLNEAPRQFSWVENPIPHLFQIIFILFIISPPIIVILLLIIIKKMNNKSN